MFGIFLKSILAMSFSITIWEEEDGWDTLPLFFLCKDTHVEAYLISTLSIIDS